MKTSNFLLAALASIAVLSCKKEELGLYEESRRYCRDNVVFTCEGPQGERFFSGKINGIAFCVSDSVEGYRASNGVGTETVTSTQNPVLTPGATPVSTLYSFSFDPRVIDNLNGLYEELAPYVYIYTPFVNDTMVFKASEYIERFIKKGDLPLRDWTKDKYSAFDFSIGWRCTLLPGYNHYQQKNPESIPSVGSGFGVSFGPQHDAAFRVSEFEKIKTPEQVIYNITFEVECNLYYNSSADDYAYYGRLTEGIFKTQVVLLPHE